MFGSPETTSGGRALKFFASVRIDIRRKDQIKTPEGKVIGNRTKIKVVKNKIAPPFTEVEFDIMYDEGISKTGSLIDLGIEHKVLEKKGAWIAYEGALVGQGRDAAKAALKEKPELAEKITKAVLEKAQVVGGTDVTGEETDRTRGGDCCPSPRMKPVVHRAARWRQTFVAALGFALLGVMSTLDREVAAAEATSAPVLLS
eukprot:gene5239-7107_t